MAQYNNQLDAFTLYHKAQENQKSLLGGPALPALGHAIAGSTGAAISNLALYPLDLIVTRLQTQRQLRKDDVANPNRTEYKSIQDAFEKIYNEEGGLPAFYSGVLQDTAKTVADSFLFFLAYNFIRQSRMRSRSQKSAVLPILDELTIGMAAGAFSKLFTTPIQNIVTRKQTAALTSSSLHPRNTSTRAIMQQIYREKGLSGFWSGYSATLILTLNPSLTFFLHSTLTRLLLPSYRRDNPGATPTFLLAAISKAIASTITYPFSLAKTRTQVSSAAKPGVPASTRSNIEMKEELENISNGRFNATPRSRRVVAQTTVLSTILHIARTEGVGALYEGLYAEVLKGFFSHGITMLVKERVHNLIIAAYYFILRGLEKYPSPEEMKTQAQEKAGNVVEEGRRMVGSVGDRVRKGVEDGKGMVGDVYGKGKEGFTSAGQKAGEVVERGKEMVGGAVERGREMVEGAMGRGKEAIGNATESVQQGVEEGKARASNASESAQMSLENSKQSAGNLYTKSKTAATDAYSRAADSAAELYSKNKDAASGAYEKSKASTSGAYEKTKDVASDAYEKTKDVAGGAYETGKEIAGDVSVKQTGKEIVWGPGAETREERMMDVPVPNITEDDV